MGRVCTGAHRQYWKAVWDGGLTFGLRACVISADVVGGKRGKQDHLVWLARHRFGLDSRNKLGRKVSGQTLNDVEQLQDFLLAQGVNLVVQ